MDRRLRTMADQVTGAAAPTAVVALVAEATPTEEAAAGIPVAGEAAEGATPVVVVEATAAGDRTPA